MANPPDVPRKIRSVWPPILLLALSVVFVIWAQNYNPGPRLMPTIVGSITALLCLLDIIARLDNPIGAVLRLSLGADFRNREMSHDPSLSAEAGQLGWMVFLIAMIMSFGILPSVPLFVALYMRVHGELSWAQSILAALVVLGFVAAVFEFLLDYTLYRGVLFDPKGFDAW